MISPPILQEKKASAANSKIKEFMQEEAKCMGKETEGAAPQFQFHAIKRLNFLFHKT